MSDTYRYHAAPPAGTWMNDPNGLVRHDGRWQLFAQYSAAGPEFREIGWGRWTSADLLDWRFEGVAIPANAHGLAYSGTVRREGAGLAAFLTRHATGEGGMQRQWRMTSGDAAHWTADAAPCGPAGRDMRDPFVLFCEATRDWRMIVAAPSNWNDGDSGPPSELVLWRSGDRVHWEPAGRIGPWMPAGVMWEVPVLLDFGARQALIVSIVDRRGGGSACSVVYWLGRFTGDGFEADGPAALLDDGSDFYATCCATEDDHHRGERILIAWASSWATARRFDWPGGIGGGPLTLPRRLWIEGDALRQAPIAAAEPLARRVALGGEVRLAFASAGASLAVTIDADGALHAERVLDATGERWERTVAGFAGETGDLLVFEDAGLVEIFSPLGRTMTVALPA